MLELKNISKAYGKKTVLGNITLQFEEGQIVFLVGKSGCGKSTLLNIMGGLDDADFGQVVFDGKDVDSNDVSYRKKAVGFVFQDFNIIRGLTVGQNIAIAKQNHDKEWIDTKTKELGVDKKQKVQTLSGGEKQRVALLRALYKDAKIILADEPTGNLDSANSQLVLEHFCKLKDEGKIIIIVSHDLESANKYADRIVELKDGTVVSDNIVQKDNAIQNKPIQEQKTTDNKPKKETCIKGV